MLNSILTGSGLTFSSFLICTGASLVLGILSALLYMYKNTYTRSFAIMLALLPCMIQVIISLVNGELGTGIAVMGAFSLVRFRSAPGNAREIGAVILAMALGLATGMGYIAVAVLLAVVIALAQILLLAVGFGEARQPVSELKITIPENMDYAGLFDDLLDKYTTSREMVRVRTTNMGTMYELTYHIRLRGAVPDKEFIDQLRVRNGNLNISFGRVTTIREEL